MQTATTLKPALNLLSEPQIFVACISQQGQSYQRSFYQCCTVKFDFSHDIIVFANWMHVFGKTPLQSKACNWAKFGPIPMITD